MTSRRLDRETGQPTFKGNMHLSPVQQGILRHMNKGQDEMKASDRRKLVKVTKDAGGEMRVTDKGVEVDEVR